MKKFFIILSVCILLLLVVFLLEHYKTSRIEKCEDCNVIIFIVDALRADHLGSYGYYRNTSPNIDKLTDNGILFRNEFSQSCNTLPSITSIFTSTYPYSHGVQYVYKDELSDKIPTLTEILKIYGYKTAAFDNPEDPFVSQLLVNFDEVYKMGIRAEWSNNEIFDWMKNNSDDKFFIYYHTSNVHAPYLVENTEDVKFTNSEYSGLVGTYNELLEITFYKMRNYYNNDREKLYRFFDKDYLEENKDLFTGEYDTNKSYKMFHDNPLLFSLVKEEFYNNLSKSDSGIQHMIDLYDTKIYLEDQFLGKIFEKIDELNLSKNTIIIITADHGEEFNEHGNFDHKELYDEVLHVPLIIKVPGNHDKILIEDLTQSIDLMPTILDLVNIPINHESQGASLLTLINDRKDSIRNNYVFSQWGETYAIRSKDWKLYIRGNYSELYYLKNDPGENINIISQRGDVAEKLLIEFYKWKNILPNYSTNSSFSQEIDTERMRNIIQTGYW